MIGEVLLIVSRQIHIAYIPDGKIIGISKLARIAEMYSRRLQIQERLTQQVAEAIRKILDPAGVAVAVKASHLCMVMRGVEKAGATTITTAFLGRFKDDQNLSMQFLANLK